MQRLLYSFMIVLVFCGLRLLPAWANPLTSDLTVSATTQTIILNGYTHAIDTRRVAAEFGGRVARVAYDVGQTIGKTAVVELDRTFIDLTIEKTTHQLQKLTVNRDRLGSRTAYLDKQYRRIESLHQGHRATEVKRDTAMEELTQARFEAQVLENEIAAAQSGLKELQERRKRHLIYAPQGWQVVSKSVEPGEIVAAGQPLMRVADFRTLVVPFSLSSPELTALQAKGAILDLKIQGKAGRAVVNWINPEFNPQTRKTEVELRLKDHSGVARGGLLCQLTLALPAENLSVPKKAVMERYENPRVRLTDTMESINIIVLGETDTHLIIAPNAALKTGVRLQSQP